MLVYTVWLKPRTTHNIVIGGAAGAVPPLVGWAAATGGLTVDALYPFGIVFLWTPPHFWALALLLKDDYARAQIPMLPVARGEAATRRQILVYSVALVAFTVLPYATGLFGGLYLAAALGAGSRFRGPRGAALAAPLAPGGGRPSPRLARLPGTPLLRDGAGPSALEFVGVELLWPLLYPSLIGVVCLAYLGWCVIRAAPDVDEAPPEADDHDPASLAPQSTPAPRPSPRPARARKSPGRAPRDRAPN